MTDQTDFPIPLLDFLISVVFATEEAQGYVSRSKSKESGEVATTDLALQYFRQSTGPLREDERVDYKVLESVFRTWSWAYHLESSKDLLRKIARAGVVQARDVGHAGTMLEECRKRFPSPEFELRSLGHLQFGLDREYERECGAFSASTGEAHLIKRLRSVLRGAMCSMMSERVSGFYFTLVAFQIPGITHGRDKEKNDDQAVKFLSALLDNCRDAHSPNYDSPRLFTSPVAVVRIAPEIFALLITGTFKMNAKRYCEEFIASLGEENRPVGAEGSPLPILAGLTDFYDYPDDIDLVEGTFFLPRRKPVHRNSGASLHFPNPKYYLTNALIALNQARPDTGDQIILYSPTDEFSPEAAKETDGSPRLSHPKTPETK